MSTVASQKIAMDTYEELQDFPEKILINDRETTRCTSPFRHVQKLMSSGLLLKGFALSFGLWNPRRRWRAVFALTFLLVDIYYSIQSIAYTFLCPTQGSALDSYMMDFFLCDNSTSKSSSFVVNRVHFISPVNESSLLFLVVVFSRLVSHVTFLCILWMLPLRENCVSQNNTLELTKLSSWTKLNCKILFFLFVLISFALWQLIDGDYEKQFFASHFVVIWAYCISKWSSLVICWLFGTVISSLETLIDRCVTDIKTSEELDDIIKLHQQLCKIIFGTSNAFKLWFIVHWILHTLSCVIWVAKILLHFQLLFHFLNAMCHTVISAVIYAYILIYPCYKAAVLTGKCQQMLAEFNMMDKEDWHRTHPFCKRSELHLFLQYASYANCGYKVGRLTFGSMSVFFSALLAMIGIGFKILL